MTGIRDGAVVEVATENDASALVLADVARHGIGLNSALLCGGGQFLDDECRFFLGLFALQFALGECPELLLFFL